MYFRKHTNAVVRWRSMLAAFLVCLIPYATNAADPAGAAADSPASDSKTMNAILEELKAIHQVLEKIEKQGLAQGQNRPARPTTATVAISKDKHVMGSQSAPVTVVEFADYQCPFCLRFIKTTFPQLKKDYIDTGKVRWVSLNMPLSFHKDARKAAQAALCAGDQDKFWEMREELFKNPKKLAEEFLPEHAASIGIDVEAFKGCLASDRHFNEIEQDTKDANSIRLTGTPSFVIGKTASDKIFGQVVIGAQPINVFTAAIQKALGENAGADKPGTEKSADKKQPAGAG